jgi:phosphoribosyl-ATP pyrophosphohydrolase
MSSITARSRATSKGCYVARLQDNAAMVRKREAEEATEFTDMDQKAGDMEVEDKRDCG